MKAKSLIFYIGFLSLHAIASVDCNQAEPIIKIDATQLLERNDYESMARDHGLPKAGVYYRYFRLIRDTYSYELWYDTEHNRLKSSIFSMDSKGNNFKSKEKAKKLTSIQREQYRCLIKKAWESKIPSKAFEVESEERRKLCSVKKSNENLTTVVSNESLRIFKNCQINLGDKNQLCEKITGVRSAAPIVDRVVDMDECDLGEFPYLNRGSSHDSQELILIDGNDFKVFHYNDADSPEAKELRAFFMRYWNNQRFSQGVIITNAFIFLNVRFWPFFKFDF